jgi:hypothetical protein
MRRLCRFLAALLIPAADASFEDTPPRALGKPLSPKR